MTAKTAAEREALLRLADALVEDVLTAPDRDILAEAADDGVDVEQVAVAMRALFDQIESEPGKRKMAAARAAVDADRQGPALVSQLDAAAARRRLTAAISANSEAVGRLTLAARKAGELSDDDVRALLEDLEELGIVPASDGQGGKP